LARGITAEVTRDDVADIGCAEQLVQSLANELTDVVIRCLQLIEERRPSVNDRYDILDVVAGYQVPLAS
jgi:hypothetical protein